MLSSGIWKSGVFGVVEEILSSPLTTLSAFFLRHTSARNDQRLSSRVESQSLLRTWARHHLLATISWPSLFVAPTFLADQPQQENSFPDIQQRIFLLAILIPHYDQMY